MVLDSFWGFCVHCWGRPSQLSRSTVTWVVTTSLVLFTRPHCPSHSLQFPHVQFTVGQTHGTFRCSRSDLSGQDWGSPSQCGRWTVTWVASSMRLRVAGPHDADQCSHLDQPHSTVWHEHSVSRCSTFRTKYKNTQCSDFRYSSSWARLVRS